MSDTDPSPRQSFLPNLEQMVESFQSLDFGMGYIDSTERFCRELARQVESASSFDQLKSELLMIVKEQSEAAEKANELLP